MCSVGGLQRVRVLTRPLHAVCPVSSRACERQMRLIIAVDCSVAISA